MDESKQGNLLAGPEWYRHEQRSMLRTGCKPTSLFAEHLDALGGGVAHSIKGRARMNSRFPDDLINAPNEDIPAAIPGLIDAAVAVLDADRDTSRRYLLRASAILRVKPRRTDAESTRSQSRGGLLAWQLNRIVDYIETHLADKIAVKALADLIRVSASLAYFERSKSASVLLPFNTLRGGVSSLHAH